jgi:dihydrofolate reductase
MNHPRKIIVHIADGYIARPDGDVAWLDRPRPKGNYGMPAFFKSIDTTLWGYKTYAKGLEMGGIEKGMKAAGFGPEIKNYVFSRHSRESTVRFVNKPVKTFAQRLRAQPGKDIWMIGGGEIIASFLDQAKSTSSASTSSPSSSAKASPSFSLAIAPSASNSSPPKPSPMARPPPLPHQASFLTKRPSRAFPRTSFRTEQADAFSFRFAPAKRSACAERNLSSLRFSCGTCPDSNRELRQNTSPPHDPRSIPC